jgi:hypothetical protein
MTEAEKWIAEWNAEQPVGTFLHVLVGSGEWVRVKQASRAFIRNNVAVVRVQGFRDPVRLLDVAPVPRRGNHGKR